MDGEPVPMRIPQNDDWPGYFPNGAEMVRLMVSAGASSNAADRRSGPRPGCDGSLPWC
ncbi:MAG: hypothetical protein ACR2MP_13115 [Streptosporangiaceae bacterium]